MKLQQNIKIQVSRDWNQSTFGNFLVKDLWKSLKNQGTPGGPLGSPYSPFLTPKPKLGALKNKKKQKSGKTLKNQGTHI